MSGEWCSSWRAAPATSASRTSIGRARVVPVGCLTWLRFAGLARGPRAGRRGPRATPWEQSAAAVCIRLRGALKVESSHADCEVATGGQGCRGLPRHKVVGGLVQERFQRPKHLIEIQGRSMCRTRREEEPSTCSLHASQSPSAEIGFATPAQTGQTVCRHIHVAPVRRQVLVDLFSLARLIASVSVCCFDLVLRVAGVAKQDAAAAVSGSGRQKMSGLQMKCQASKRVTPSQGPRVGH
jgi:hypothetical protein